MLSSTSGKQMLLKRAVDWLYPPVSGCKSEIVCSRSLRIKLTAGQWEWCLEERSEMNVQVWLFDLRSDWLLSSTSVWVHQLVMLITEACCCVCKFPSHSLSPADQHHRGRSSGELQIQLCNEVWVLPLLQQGNSNVELHLLNHTQSHSHCLNFVLRFYLKC